MTNKRELNGVLLLNKPKGITSNLALQKVKRLFNAKKAGHTGALDPLATGMLPICFGEATKFSQFLLEADKTYEVTAKLGVLTDSGDADGEVIEEKLVPTITTKQLEQVLQQFRGPQQQIPPLYSALKYQGRPMYAWARAGKDVPRQPRDITIYDLTLLSFNNDQLQLRVHCSKGTYIRSLIMDIGAELECGAHVTELHRVNVSPFIEQDMHEFTQLKQLAESDIAKLDDYLLPVTCMLEHLPRVELDKEQTQKIKFGQLVSLPAEDHRPGIVRLYASDDEPEFIGIGEINEEGTLKAKRLLNVNIAD